MDQSTVLLKRTLAAVVRDPELCAALRAVTGRTFILPIGSVLDTAVNKSSKHLPHWSLNSNEKTYNKLNMQFIDMGKNTNAMEQNNTKKGTETPEVHSLHKGPSRVPS